MRVVLDTNIVLSTLLFRKGHLAWLRTAWEKHDFTLLVNQETANELLRVLAYPKFKLALDEIEYLFRRYIQYAEVIDNIDIPIDLPICRDLADQKFLQLAVNGYADVLVTGDRDLLTLCGQTAFAIETANIFSSRFTTNLV
jgi:putative PIN family toxin of toxin-antitoxin system